MTPATTPPNPGYSVKEIGWAYPSSETAALFGYSSADCYVLRHGVWPGPLEAVAGCVGTSPLIVMGERLDGVWSPKSMVYNPA